MTQSKTGTVDDGFRTRALLVALVLSSMLAVAGCSAPASAPAAPAAEEAAAPAAAVGAATEAAAEAAPAAATEAAASADRDIEAPDVNPAGQAQEATAQPESQDGVRATPAAAPSGEPARAMAGTRRFRLTPEQSRARYQVEEEFFGQPVPFVTAIGTTQSLAGDVTLAFGENTVEILDGKFTVDLSTLTSDRPRRDQAIRERWLESGKYPLATFVTTGVANLPPDAALGTDVPFQVMGDLTIREVTRPATWDMTARVDGATLTGSGQTVLQMQDFGFEPPAVVGILKVTDGVTVTVEFVAAEVR